MPTATTFDGMSLVTTDPAPIVTLSATSVKQSKNQLKTGGKLLSYKILDRPDHPANKLQFMHVDTMDVIYGLSTVSWKPNFRYANLNSIK